MKNLVYFHPLLFALFPLLSLYQTNADILPFGEVFWDALLVLGLSGLLWLGVHALVRDIHKSALLASSFLFLFFSFGHFLLGLRKLAFLADSLQAVRALTETRAGMFAWLGLWALLFALAAATILRTRRDLEALNRLFAVLAAALVVVTALALIDASYLRGARSAAAGRRAIDAWRQRVESEPLMVDPQESAEPLPDIYYIIVDGYGRGDVLEELYGLDNTPFYDFLESEGFYLADEARANYSHTAFSLVSALNMAFLDELMAGEGQNAQSLLPLGAMIEDSRVIHNLHALGYQTVAFATGFTVTEVRAADVYLAPEGDVHQFQQLLLNNTMLSPFLLSAQYDIHRDRILNVLERLPQVARMQAPTFTFAHVVAPHPPFVLDADGQPLYPQRAYDIYDGSEFIAVASKQEYLAGYKAQLTYINASVEAALEAILRESDTPPIILLQGDHGPGSELDRQSAADSNKLERMAILNAYYFPEENYDALYPAITPVNSFRLVFNDYFGGHLALLPDTSYFSSLSQIFDFSDVTDELVVNPDD